MAVLLAGSILLSACGPSYEQEAKAYAEPQSEPELYQHKPATAAELTTLAPAGFQQNTVKVARLGFGVTDYNRTIARARIHIRNFGGFVASENEQHRNQITNTLVVRIPNRNFSALLDSLQKMAVEPDYRTMSVSNVTARLNELTEQVKHREADMAALAKQEKAARSLDGKFAASSRKRAVSAEIEGARQQMHSLEEQISFSTITLVIRECYQLAELEEPGFGTRLAESFKVGLTVIGDLVVSAMYAWPLWLLLIGGGFIGFRQYQRIRVRKNNHSSSNLQKA